MERGRQGAITRGEGGMNRNVDVPRLALSAVLSVCMVVSSVPVPALAEAVEIASGGG